MKTILYAIWFVIALKAAAQSLYVDSLSIGNTAVFSATNGLLLCVDPTDGEVVFQCDTTDPSLEVPGLLHVGTFLDVGGPAHFRSTIVLLPTYPTNHTYNTKFPDQVIVCDAGKARNIVMNPGHDGRLLTVKDAGGASSSNIVITDVHGELIDGASSLKLTNDYQSVTLIYDYVRTRWLSIQR